MKISIILHTQDFRGDHSADVAIACEVIEGETVQDLADRLLKQDSAHGVDRIEIRAVRPNTEVTA